MEENERNCPNCNTSISYSSKSVLKIAIQKNSKCRRCATKEVANRRDVKDKASFRMKGSNNPGYGGKIWNGRKHSDSSKMKSSFSQIDRFLKNPVTEDFRNKISEVTLGSKNPMYGKSFYSVWVNKYGIDIANMKMDYFKSKISDLTKGEKNPMYGKSSPIGSGNGWSGWYKNIYFRSLHELTFLVNWVERFDLKIENGENKRFSIDYIYDGKNRIYSPDFLVNRKYLVEIKPKKLINTRINLKKFESAYEFCRVKGLTFKIIDPGILEYNIILKLYLNGDIRFIERYEIKFLEF